MTYEEEKLPPLIMGILNVTPDSFSDGGRYFDQNAAFQHAAQMVKEGADIIDIGGESTRPGAQPISVQEELDRVIPIIEKVHLAFPIKISIDTSQAAVMQAALQAGATIINDVRALQAPDALTVAANSDAQICLMHMQSTPSTMQINPSYQHVIQDIKLFLQQRVNICINAGINKKRLWLDPGFGFGKNLQHNADLLNHLDELHELGCPILVGLSRKAMIGMALGTPVTERLPASLALATLALTKGAQIFRVHDVAASIQALKMAHVILTT